MAPKKDTKKPAEAKKTTEPKKAAPAAAAGAAPKKAAGAGGKKNSSADDEMAFLDAQMKTANKDKQELDQKKKEDKKKDNEKKIEREKLQRIQDQQKAAAIAKLPPLYVDDVCKQLFERHGGETQKDSFRDMCWLHFALFNFFNMAIETKRKLLFRSAEHPKGEQLASFECHDVDDSEDAPHSYIVFHTASGKTYSVDLTLKQFEPKGKFGFQRDTNTEVLGWQPLAATSRLISKERSGGAHKGFVCKDGGVFPRAFGKTTLIPTDAEKEAMAAKEAEKAEKAKAAKEAKEAKDAAPKEEVKDAPAAAAAAAPAATTTPAPKGAPKGAKKGGKPAPKKAEAKDANADVEEEKEPEIIVGVPEGTTNTYLKFLKAAQSGRHQDMPTSEARSARILFKNKVGSLLADCHTELEAHWFTKPLAAAEAETKEKVADAETKKE